MKRFLFLLSMTALILPLSCTEPSVEPDGEEPGNGDETTTEEPSYKVGDYYKVGLAKGIVVSVNEDGKSGLIMSLDEENLMWSTDYEIITGAMEVSMEDGHVNCEAIKYYITDWAIKYPAIAWCSKKNVGSLTSWYLPAGYELEGIWNSTHEIQDEFNAALVENGGTALSFGSSDFYWSSTDAGPSIAYSYSFETGEIDYYSCDKMLKHHVRCVRKF